MWPPKPNPTLKNRRTEDFLARLSRGWVGADPRRRGGLTAKGGRVSLGCRVSSITSSSSGPDEGVECLQQRHPFFIHSRAPHTWSARNVTGGTLLLSHQVTALGQEHETHGQD